jgi:hypothetical protein
MPHGSYFSLTVCLLLRCGHALSVMKNCEPFVLGPLLAIDRMPLPLHPHTKTKNKKCKYSACMYVVPNVHVDVEQVAYGMNIFTCKLQHDHTRISSHGRVGRSSQLEGLQSHTQTTHTHGHGHAHGHLCVNLLSNSSSNLSFHIDSPPRPVPAKGVSILYVQIQTYIYKSYIHVLTHTHMNIHTCRHTYTHSKKYI